MQRKTAVRPAADPTECNCLALRQATRRVTQFYESHLTPLGLSSAQYSILSKLSRLGPQSINDLSALMVMDRTTAGRAIQPLERNKYVVVETGNDQRRRIISITAAGKALLKQAQAGWRKAQAEFEKFYGAAAASELRAALARAVSVVDGNTAQ